MTTSIDNQTQPATEIPLDELRERMKSSLPSLKDRDQSKEVDSTDIKPSNERYTSQEYADQEWWLLGTTGCHLCEVAEQLLIRFQAVEPIRYRHVDIADFDEDLMMAFATTIPVIITKNKRLNYPFSVMDLQQLL